MLLIGQPKSASTSLACTLAKIGNLTIKLGIPKHSHDVKCKGFEEVQRYHNNMSKRSHLFLSQVIKGRKTLFKEHILPTDSHLKDLSTFKDNFAILLRSPEASYDAYKRIGAKVNKGLLNDLINFHNRFMWWASNKANVLVIYYEDLILNYNQTMKKLLKHYQINGKIIPLMKKKYTGTGLKRLKG